MNSRDIVRKAWQITQVHTKKLIWYGAVPAFLNIVVVGMYLAYQYEAFKSSGLFNDGQGPDLAKTVSTIWGLVAAHPMGTIGLLVVALIFAVAYFIFRPILTGALIQAVMRIKNYESIHGSFEVGVRRFFPLFEFGLVTGLFSINTLMSEGSFILRWWGQGVFFVALPILLFIAMAGLLISFLFMYTEYYIVLEDHKLIQAMKESAILVISNLRKTILVFILMLLISARIILNVVIVLLVPLLAIVLSNYFAGFIFSLPGLILISVLGTLFLVFGSYMLGLFQIFATTVWVMTFGLLADKGQPEIKDVDLGGDNLQKSHMGVHGAPEKVPVDNN